MPAANGLGVKCIRVRPIFNSLVPSLQLSDLPIYIIKSPPLFSTQRLAVMSPLPMGMDPGDPLVLGDVQTTLNVASLDRTSAGKSAARLEWLFGIRSPDNKAKSNTEPRNCS